MVFTFEKRSFEMHFFRAFSKALPPTCRTKDGRTLGGQRPQPAAAQATRGRQLGFCLWGVFPVSCTVVLLALWCSPSVFCSRAPVML